jgi:hypothetical protein
MKTKLTKQQFQTWLEGFSPRTKVGSREFDKTPVIKFIEKHGLTDAKIPTWAFTFTEKLMSGSGKSVSAQAALAILN